MKIIYVIFTMLLVSAQTAEAGFVCTGLSIREGYTTKFSMRRSASGKPVFVGEIFDTRGAVEWSEARAVASTRVTSKEIYSKSVIIRKSSRSSDPSYWELKTKATGPGKYEGVLTEYNYYRKFGFKRYWYPDLTFKLDCRIAP